MKRRNFLKGLGVFGIGALGVTGQQYWPDAGWSDPCNTPALPPALRDDPFIQQAFEGVDFSQVWDMHAHLVGIGDSGGGIWINPAMHSVLNPVQYTQRAFYLNAACATDAAGTVDDSYVARLQALAAGFPAGFKLMLYAFDQFYDEAGKARPALSQFYVPNRAAAEVARLVPQQFEWVASIHPNRRDWKEALDRCKADGARAVKWLPPSMGMDPANPRYELFYQQMAALDLPLISHAGDEHATQGAGQQDYGNPLRLRRALDQGVNVIVAHCATQGAGIDLDRGQHAGKMDNFELFARMMAQPEYAKNLYGDISAITQINRMAYLKPLLARHDWHARLLNGSDYPLPGVMPLFSVKRIAAAGLIPERAVAPLNDLRQHNALLFDFVLKRTLSWQGSRFPAHVFETRHVFSWPKQ
ncbi:MAG: amidohydrolase [Thiobacillaceae bacterium]